MPLRKEVCLARLLIEDAGLTKMPRFLLLNKYLLESTNHKVQTPTQNNGAFDVSSDFVIGDCCTNRLCFAWQTNIESKQIKLENLSF